MTLPTVQASHTLGMSVLPCSLPFLSSPLLFCPLSSPPPPDPPIYVIVSEDANLILQHMHVYTVSVS